MNDFTECAGNGLTRCLVCNSIGCETWCPLHTLDPDEREADKARRLRICEEIVGLRKTVEARDAEIADLKTELSGTLDVNDIANREIDRLRKVADAAAKALPVVLLFINTPLPEIKDLENALAELDGTAS